jgi:hypothetical protein
MTDHRILLSRLTPVLESAALSSTSLHPTSLADPCVFLPATLLLVTPPAAWDFHKALYWVLSFSLSTRHLSVASPPTSTSLYSNMLMTLKLFLLLQLTPSSLTSPDLSSALAHFTRFFYNGLALNGDKFEVITFGTHQKLCYYPPLTGISIAGSLVPPFQHHKDSTSRLTVNSVVTRGMLCSASFISI